MHFHKHCYRVRVIEGGGLALAVEALLEGIVGVRVKHSSVQSVDGVTY